jgi:hypothetical protein
MGGVTLLLEGRETGMGVPQALPEQTRIIPAGGALATFKTVSKMACVKIFPLKINMLQLNWLVAFLAQNYNGDLENGKPEFSPNVERASGNAVQGRLKQSVQETPVTENYMN